MMFIKNIKRVIRYNKLYGFRRTIIKIAGRTRDSRLRIFFPCIQKRKKVSLIGCGQFGFSTISYFLYKNCGSCFLQCYDIDETKSLTTAAFWGYQHVKDWHEIIANSDCKYVYIASDHYSHASYAIEAILAGKIVYCEKPISVNKVQFNDLKDTIEKYNPEIYFGYNRPFSKAINDLSKYIKNSKNPITLTCFISGHKLNKSHWYNDPKEGTRICGNMGHWIDLSMYIFEVRGYIPTKFEISINYADVNDADDNIAVSYNTDFGDIVTIVLTSRNEPFEGINETINLQCGKVISKIDDFRMQTIWIDDALKKIRYSPKDVGHNKSINQPFSKETRNINTVMNSTELMLNIAEMVQNNITHSTYMMHSALSNSRELNTQNSTKLSNV